MFSGTETKENDISLSRPKTVNREEIANEADEDKLYEALSQSIAQADYEHLPSFHETKSLTHKELAPCYFDDSYEIKSYLDKLVLWHTEKTKDIVQQRHDIYTSSGFYYERSDGYVSGPNSFNDPIAFRAGSTFGNVETIQSSHFRIMDMCFTFNGTLIFGGGEDNRDCKIKTYTGFDLLPLSGDKGIPTRQTIPLIDDVFIAGRCEGHTQIRRYNEVLAEIPPATCYAVSRDSWFAMGDLNSKIQIYSYDQIGRVQFRNAWEAGHKFHIDHLAVVKNNILASCGGDSYGFLSPRYGNAIKLWNAANGTLLYELQPPSDTYQIGSMLGLPHGWLCVNERNRNNSSYQIKVWNTDIQKIELTLPGSKITLSPDEELIIINKHKIRFFDVSTRKKEKMLPTSPYTGFSSLTKFKLFQLHNYIKDNNANFSALSITDAEIPMILRLLRHNSSFKEFNASFSQLTHEGVEHIAKIYLYNTHFTKITLQGSRLRDLELGYFAFHARHNKTLTALDFSNNMVTSSKIELEQINQDFIKSKSNLIEIDVSQNYLLKDCDALFKPSKEDKSVFQFSIFKTKGKETPSIVCPREIISLTQWIVCLACPKSSEHAFILLEGMRPNGQLFLTKFDMQAPQLKGYAKIKAQDWNPSTFNKDSVLFQFQTISAMDGEKLIKNIELEFDKRIPFDMFSTKATNKSINCLQWAENKLASIGVLFDEPLSPLPSSHAKGKSCTVQ